MNTQKVMQLTEIALLNYFRIRNDKPSRDQAEKLQCFINGEDKAGLDLVSHTIGVHPEHAQTVHYFVWKRTE